MSSIVIVILTLALILTGGLVLAAALCLISIIAYLELTKAAGVGSQDRAMKTSDSGKQHIWVSTKKINGLEITGIVLIILYYAGIYVGTMQTDEYDRSVIYAVIGAGIILSLLVYMFVYVFSFPKFKAVNVMAAFFEFVYAPVLLSFLYIIREGWSQGIYLIWLVFLCSWGSDTCAYCVGILIGKHKMTPKLSPKKSVEGAVGGVVGAALLFGLYANYVINPFSTQEIGWLSAMCLGAVGALLSMVGDLAASAIKRDHDIKDYGKLIPGHGGIMDRFDSVIVAAPLIFLGLSVITVW